MKAFVKICGCETLSVVIFRLSCKNIFSTTVLVYSMETLVNQPSFKMWFLLLLKLFSITSYDLCHCLFYTIKFHFHNCYENAKYLRFPIDSLAPLITQESHFAAISRKVSSRECHFRQPREQVAFNKAPSRQFTFFRQLAYW